MFLWKPGKTDPRKVFYVYCIMNHGIKIYNLLLDKNFSKEEAEVFVNELETSMERKVENLKDIITTKEDLHKAMMANREDLHKNVERLNDTINKNALAAKEDLRTAVERITDNANKHLMWLVGALLGQVGLVFLVLRLIGVFD